MELARLRTELENWGVSLSDWAVLRNLAHHPMLPHFLRSELCGSTDPAEASACDEAIRSCVGKGWIQQVDERELDSVASELSGFELTSSPAYYPVRGAYDFTRPGHMLYSEIRSQLFPGEESGTHYFVRAYAEEYFLSNAELSEVALRSVQESLADPGYRAVWSPPEWVGGWLGHAWEYHPSGLRLEASQEWDVTPSGWHAFALDPERDWANGSEESAPGAGPALRHLSLSQLRSSLAPSGVSLLEWVLLSAFADALYEQTPSQVMVRAARWFQHRATVVPSTDEWKAAWGACLTKGWLRMADPQPPVEDLAGFQAQGRLTGPVCPLPPLGDVDFTVPGAELFLRLFSEFHGEHRQWRGPCEYAPHVPGDWRCYRRDVSHTVRHYSVVDRFPDAILRRTDSACPLRPLNVSGVRRAGPWCVSRWERYPHGYYVDVTFGR